MSETWSSFQARNDHITNNYYKSKKINGSIINGTRKSRKTPPAQDIRTTPVRIFPAQDAQVAQDPRKSRQTHAIAPKLRKTRARPLRKTTPPAQDHRARSAQDTPCNFIPINHRPYCTKALHDPRYFCVFGVKSSEETHMS